MGNAMQQLLSGFSQSTGQNEPSCDLSSSAIRLVKAPVRADLSLQLEAMAHVLHTTPECLAGAILNAAIVDLEDHLGEALLGKVQQECQVILDASRPENNPSVVFNSGGT